MRAIVDAAHVPAPGARDLSIEELNVHGPFFQYWVLLKVGGWVGGSGDCGGWGPGGDLER